MDELVEQRDPGPVEVALLYQRVGDERHLIYLYDRANGPGWFRALQQPEPLLLPLQKGPGARDRTSNASPRCIPMKCLHGFQDSPPAI